MRPPVSFSGNYHLSGDLFVSALGYPVLNYESYGDPAMATISTLSSTNVWISAVCTQAMPPNARLALKTEWEDDRTTQLAPSPYHHTIITIATRLDSITALSDGGGASST
jgi:hypothetical protein